MSKPGFELSTPKWMRGVLRAAGVYNLVWGGWVVLFPTGLFAISGWQPPRYPQLWQCLGMVVAVYGVGYLIAARSPVRHWVIVLVGLLGKILGPIGFIAAAIAGDLPWTWGLMILTNDLLWWIPFGAILFHAACVRGDTAAGSEELELKRAIQECRSHRGITLEQLSREKPTLVVFLRHAGCTFCRACLADLAEVRAKVEAAGVRLAIVHMSAPLAATIRLESHGLGDVHRFSDPCCVLYRSFGLPRGTARQMFGVGVCWRSFRSAILEGHGLGKLEGDGFRLSGVFLLRRGTIVAEHRAASAADRPDFMRIVRQADATKQVTGNATPRPQNGAMVEV